MEPYQPVSRDFYEEVELLIVQKRSCDITFTASNDAVSRITGHLNKLYSRDGIEYLVLGNGLEIALNKIISLNGKRPQSFC